LQIGQVLPAVHGRHHARGHVLKERKVKLVDVEVQNVEFGGGAAHLR
jgi:hypothetical protein